LGIILQVYLPRCGEISPLVSVTCPRIRDARRVTWTVRCSVTLLISKEIAQVEC
jgi:hypothetical protein